MMPISQPLFCDLLLGSTACLCKGHWSPIVQCPRNIISFSLKKDILVRGQKINFNCLCYFTGFYMFFSFILNRRSFSLYIYHYVVL